MTLTAGIDVGNATTEIVIGRVVGGRVDVVAADRTPTRNTKGSPESLAGAVSLIRRLERKHGGRVTGAVVAPLRPVRTMSGSVADAARNTGRLTGFAGRGSTAGGAGFGAGVPWVLGTPEVGGTRVVALVPHRIRYDEAARQLSALAGAGRLAAVLLQNDEAVLVANRLPVQVPVVDEVDITLLVDALQVAVEVGFDGRPLQHVTDPFRLTSVLRLHEGELSHATAVTTTLYDAASAVVAVQPSRAGRPAPVASSAWIGFPSGRVPFLEGHRRVREGVVGTACSFAVPPEKAQAVDDLWTLDLADVSASVQARRLAPHDRPVTLAAILSEAPYTDPGEALTALLDAPVHTVDSESAAARAGALSTPGAGPASIVVDLGGGTIDAVSGSGSVVAAGAGDQLTTSVASLTGTSRAAAEWVKRGPAHRVETPQVLLGEDGGRGFLDRPAAAETIGALVARGPAGLLPFSRTLAPGEWRALRLRVKVDLLGGNVARALRTLDEPPRTVIVVGGCAGDDEVLAAVAGALPPGTAVGRGNVAGRLGHRYAVAHGLLSAVAEHHRGG